MSSSLPVLSRQPELQETPFRTSYPFWQRLLLLAVGVVLIGLLITARWLQPNPQGMGTHQQLGLQPCTLVQLFDLRCPACGMTTSWSLFTRGQWWSALATNSGGTLLALAAAVSAPWMVGAGIWGRSLLPVPPLEWIVGLTLTVTLVTLVDWSLRTVPRLIERGFGS